LTTVVTGGGGGGLVMILGLAITLIAGVWFYRQYQKDKANQPPSTAVPAQPDSPAAATPSPTTPTTTTCNCAANASCNAFCNNTAAFSLCCFNTTTPPATVPPGTTLPPITDPLPEPNRQLCSSIFNGSCNTECGRNGDIDECEECNATCDSDVPYTGPDIQVPVPAGGAVPTASCPAGYVYNATYNVCVLSPATAAPVYPNTPIPPPLTSGPDPSRCSSVFNGSCNSECSSGSQALCDDCMRSCGTGSSGGGGRTPECSSRYNGSCNTECSSGNNSTCNSCRIACGLASASIARAFSARDARKVLNNRMYNMFKRSNPEIEVEIDYRPKKVKLSNLY
jgi:hypothetical protein